MFTDKDFDVFTIEGLDARMRAIRERLQPKLAKIGEETSSFLTASYSDTFFPHVAKHARRTVNPPDSTWVAWSTSKRGYKPLPHFQVGLWETHVFIWFALIYECEKKPTFARQMKAQLDEIWPNLPKDFVVSPDHTQPEVSSLSQLGKEGVINLLDRLENVKKAEFLCGVTLNRNDNRLRNRDELLELIGNTFTVVKPLYHLSFE